MYCGHARLCVCVCVCVCLPVCLSAAACLDYCTDPDVTWRSGRGCPLVVHYWADLQSVHGLRCYGNTRNAWQNPAVIRQAHRTPHALRRACCVRDVICNEAVTFRLYCGDVVTRTRNVSECMLVLAVCLVVPCVPSVNYNGHRNVKITEKKLTATVIKTEKISS